MPDRPKNFSGVALAPAPDDFEILDGATYGVRKISATARANARNALAPRGGVVFDGAGGRVDAPIQALNADGFSVVCTVQVPFSNPPGSSGIWGINTTRGGANETGIHLSFEASGALNLQVFPTGFGDRQDLSIAGLVPLYAGKVIQVVATRSGPTASLYVNGVLAGAQTHAKWATSLPGAWLTLGTNWGSSYAGAIYSASVYNLDLSAPDILEILELGGAVPERFKWGSQINLLGDSSFSAAFGNGVGQWLQVSSGDGATAIKEVGADSRDGSSVKCVLNSPNSSGSYSAVRQPFTLTTGKIYRRCAWARSNLAGQVFVIESEQASSDSNSFVVSPMWTEYSTSIFTGTANPALAGGMWVGLQRNRGALIGDLFVDDARLRQVGCVVHLPLDDGLGYQLQDISSNRFHGLATNTSVSHAIGFYGPARIRGITNFLGNQQFLVGVALPANSQILRVRARAQTGTPNVTLGTTSGGSQIVASTVLSTNWKLLTIALTGGEVGNSDVNLWVNSTTTDVIEWDLAWELQLP